MDLFGKSRVETAVLIDVTADSVGGGCAVFEKGKLPAVAYTHRVPIEVRDGESKTAAFARSLGDLGDALMREGAPALMRASGNGHPTRIIAAIGAPWAESSVRTERLEGDKGPFVLTKAQVEKTFKKPENLPAGKLFMDESVLATFLDGYPSKKPVGERAHRVAIVLLSTDVEQAIAEPLAAALRALYHTHDVSLAAGALTLHRGLSALFPHDADYLALRVDGDSALLLLMRRSVLLASMNLSLSADPTAALEKAFIELAKSQPLPHSIFLVASDARQELLKAAFADPRFASLWLSDIPPRILPVRPEHLQLGGKLAVIGTAGIDLPLGLMTLFCAQPEG